MHLIEVGESTVTPGECADIVYRSDVAFHRVDRFEGDDLRPLRSDKAKLFLKIGEIVMTPDELLAAGLPDPLHHRGMVHLVGKNHTVRNKPAERRERGGVRRVA